MGDLESGHIVAGQVEKAFLDELVSGLRSCKEVQGVLLAGSSAHGELLWWEEDGSRKLLSDVEVGVVTNALGKRGSLKSIASEIGRSYAYEVELFTITPKRLRLGAPKNLSFRPHAPNVLMYDLIEGGDWLWASAGFPANQFRPESLPLWEGVRLILNRAGEGAEQLLPWMQGEPVNDSAELSRWVIKLLLATGDAVLIQNGQYHPGYGERGKIWKEQVSKASTSDVLWNAITQAYDTRLGGSFDVSALDAEILRRDIASVLNTLMPGKIKVLSSIECWSDYFRRNPAPLRYQAPVAFLDRWYDTLRLLPGLQKASFSVGILLAALKHRLSVQEYAYGVIACGFFGESLGDGLHCAEQIMREYRSDGGSQANSMKAWWDAFCK